MLENGGHRMLRVGDLIERHGLNSKRGKELARCGVFLETKRWCYDNEMPIYWAAWGLAEDMQTWPQG